jgi:hypothetical protein
MADDLANQLQGLIADSDIGDQLKALMGDGGVDLGGLGDAPGRMLGGDKKG